MPIVITPTKKKKTPMPKARPKSLKADKTESLDKKFSAGVSATNKKNMQNVKKKKNGGVIDAYKKRTADSLAKTEKSRKLVKEGLSKNFGSDLSSYTKKKKLTSRKKPKQKNVSDFAGGGKLKSVPEGNKGLGKLPQPVRNKMGYMKKGGIVKMRGGGAATRGMNFNRGY